mmetsp:Transcript_23740/g.47449  ORF Transcript_23740/g.47449 Transcript_23740/m.47449 type:complete len:180 (+) Transcript_23740:371-910(+)
MNSETDTIRHENTSGSSPSSFRTKNNLNPNPNPPPSATKLQLDLWDRILQERSRQLQQLSPESFQRLVDALLADFNRRRFSRDENNNNDTTATAATIATEEGEGGEEIIDLTKGNYSAHFLTASSSSSKQNTITRESTIRHLQALYYRSIDERLSPDRRQHALDLLRLAIQNLDSLTTE